MAPRSQTASRGNSFPPLKSRKHRNNTNNLRCPNRLGEIPSDGFGAGIFLISNENILINNFYDLTIFRKLPFQRKLKKNKKKKTLRSSDSLILTTPAVIFGPQSDMLGNKTANQCPGELFIPALNLIDLYYSHHRLQTL